MTIAALAPSRILEHVVAPTLFVFVLFVAMLIAVGATWPWSASVHSTAGRAGTPPVSALLRHLVTTALAGYAIFLVIVALFHVVVAGGPVSVIGDAASGGAFLAFVVAVPVLLALAVLSRRRLR